MLKKRNPALASMLSVLIPIIYYVYWFNSTLKNWKELGGEEPKAGLYTLLLFIPVINLVILWKYCNKAKQVNEGINKFVAWLFFIIFYPISIYILQKTLNSSIELKDNTQEKIEPGLNQPTSNPPIVEEVPKQQPILKENPITSQDQQGIVEY